MLDPIMGLAGSIALTRRIGTRGGRRAFMRIFGTPPPHGILSNTLSSFSSTQPHEWAEGLAQALRESGPGFIRVGQSLARFPFGDEPEELNCFLSERRPVQANEVSDAKAALEAAVGPAFSEIGEVDWSTLYTDGIEWSVFAQGVPNDNGGEEIRYLRFMHPSMMAKMERDFELWRRFFRRVNVGEDDPAYRPMEDFERYARLQSDYGLQGAMAADFISRAGSIQGEGGYRLGLPSVDWHWTHKLLLMLVFPAWAPNLIDATPTETSALSDSASGPEPIGSGVGPRNRNANPNRQKIGTEEAGRKLSLAWKIWLEAGLVWNPESMENGLIPGGHSSEEASFPDGNSAKLWWITDPVDVVETMPQVRLFMVAALRAIDKGGAKEFTRAIREYRMASSLGIEEPIRLAFEALQASGKKAGPGVSLQRLFGLLLRSGVWFSVELYDSIRCLSLLEKQFFGGKSSELSSGLAFDAARKATDAFENTLRKRPLLHRDEGQEALLISARERALSALSVPGGHRGKKEVGHKTYVRLGLMFIFCAVIAYFAFRDHF